MKRPGEREREKQWVLQVLKVQKLLLDERKKELDDGTPSITLQGPQVISILRRAVTVGKGSSRCSF